MLLCYSVIETIKEPALLYQHDWGLVVFVILSCSKIQFDVHFHTDFSAAFTGIGCRMVPGSHWIWPISSTYSGG